MIGTQWRHDSQQRVQVYETFIHQKVAKLAEALMPAVLTCDVIRRQIEADGDEMGRVSPKKLAAFACDIAQAMYNEMEAREWLLHLPPPPTEEPQQG